MILALLMHFLKSLILVGIVFYFLSSGSARANRTDGIFSIRRGGTSLRWLPHEQDSGSYHFSTTTDDNSLPELLRELTKPYATHAYTMWRDESSRQHDRPLTSEEIDRKLKDASLSIDLVITSNSSLPHGLKIDDFHLAVVVPPPRSGYFFNAISITEEMIQKIAVFERLKPSERSAESSSVAGGRYLLIELKEEFKLFRTIVIDRKFASIALLTLYPLKLDAVVDLYQNEEQVAVPDHPGWSQNSIQIPRLASLTLLRKNVEIIHPSQEGSASCGDSLQAGTTEPISKK